MTSYSDNGWPGIDDQDKLVVTPVRGTNWRVRTAPAAAWILSEFAARFHALVESLAGPQMDDWSYAYRPVRGTTTHLSCHASGTAIDMNALTHPRGVPGTFSPAKERSLRMLLAAFADPQTKTSVLKWGGDFAHPSIVDEMHFQIRGDKAALDRVRANLSRDIVEKADIDAIIDGVFTKLTTAKIVPNKPTPDALALDPKAATTYFTIPGVLANIEYDDDRRFAPVLAKLDEILAELKKS